MFGKVLITSVYQDHLLRLQVLLVFDILWFLDLTAIDTSKFLSWACSQDKRLKLNSFFSSYSLLNSTFGTFISHSSCIKTYTYKPLCVHSAWVVRIYCVIIDTKDNEGQSWQDPELQLSSSVHSSSLFCSFFYNSSLLTPFKLCPAQSHLFCLSFQSSVLYAVGFSSFFDFLKMQRREGKKKPTPTLMDHVIWGFREPW